MKSAPFLKAEILIIKLFILEWIFGSDSFKFEIKKNKRIEERRRVERNEEKKEKFKF